MPDQDVTRAEEASMKQPRPLFIYGTLCATKLLAWALTGDASNTGRVATLAHPARVSNYKRFAVKHCDYPAVVKCAGDSTVYGYLIQLETQSQRTKLDNFEGETYIPVSVSASLLNADGEPNGQIVDADMYVWDGEDSALSYEPWSLDYFVEERLDDWLDPFEGVELVGEDE